MQFQVSGYLLLYLFVMYHSRNYDCNKHASIYGKLCHLNGNGGFSEGIGQIIIHRKFRHVIIRNRLGTEITLNGCTTF